MSGYWWGFGKQEEWMGKIIKGHKESLEGSSLIVLYVVISQVSTYIKGYQIIYFKYVQIIVCQLYLKKVLKRKSESKERKHDL